MTDPNEQLIGDALGTAALIEGETFTLEDIKLMMTLARDQERREPRPLKAANVQWITNDNAELGVKIGDQFFFLYKGESLTYDEAQHDDGSPMHWRTVGKREFGECAHPLNHDNPAMKGTVSLDDCDRWQVMPPGKYDW